MSLDLRAAAADYLAERRARGYLLEGHDSLIARFLDGLGTRAVTTIRVADAVAFARADPAIHGLHLTQRDRIHREIDHSWEGGQVR